MYHVRCVGGVVILPSSTKKRDRHASVTGPGTICPARTPTPTAPPDSPGAGPVPPGRGPWPPPPRPRRGTSTCPTETVRAGRAPVRRPLARADARGRPRTTAPADSPGAGPAPPGRGPWPPPPRPRRGTSICPTQTVLAGPPGTCPADVAPSGRTAPGNKQIKYKSGIKPRENFIADNPLCGRGKTHDIIFLPRLPAPPQ